MFRTSILPFNNIKRWGGTGWCPPVCNENSKFLASEMDVTSVVPPWCPLVPPWCPPGAPLGAPLVPPPISTTSFKSQRSSARVAAASLKKCACEEIDTHTLFHFFFQLEAPRTPPSVPHKVLRDKNSQVEMKVEYLTLCSRG